MTTPAVAIEIEKGRTDACLSLASTEGIEADIVDIKRFDGGLPTIALVLPLVSATLPFIAKVIIEEIRARRHVVVKVDGVEIRGLDVTNVERILKEARLAGKRDK